MKKTNSKAKNFFFQLSAILILASALFFYLDPQTAPYIMIIGVAGYGATTFTSPYPGKSLRGKRLFNIRILSVVLMAIATYLMFVGRNEWVIVLLISSILTLYSTIALSMAYDKEMEKKEGSNKNK